MDDDEGRGEVRLPRATRTRVSLACLDRFLQSNGASQDLGALREWFSRALIEVLLLALMIIQFCNVIVGVCFFVEWELGNMVCYG